MPYIFLRRSSHCRRIASAVFVTWLCLIAIAPASLSAAPLSKQVEIDFYRDTTSRSLKGLATRSDGRVVSGPVFTDLTGPQLADLLWTLTPADKGKWWVGSGPHGRIFEVTLDPHAPVFSSRELLRLDDTNVFAILRLPDGSLLAGTSPKGTLQLARDGKVMASVSLPVDSIYDLKMMGTDTAIAATGNPGRIYRINLRKFRTSGVTQEKTTDAKVLEERGITVFGEVRDRNLRRLAVLGDGRVLAGSAPKGNLYSFSRDGGPPILLLENREAEVTDLLVTPSDDIYAVVVFSQSNTTSTRINRPAAPPVTTPEKEAAVGPPSSPDTPLERFTGRSSVIWIPHGNGFPETLVSRSGAAFYQLVLRGEQLLIASGEQGDFVGYDLKQRRSLTFPGSVSAQLNGLVAIDSNRLLALRNNAPGLALIDFDASGPRELETRRLDLGAPSTLGALRFNRLRGISESAISLSVRTNFGSDEIEGWTPWTKLNSENGAWRAESPLRGRYFRLKLGIPSSSPSSLEMDKATLYALPQNHRPTLTDFRLFAANFGLLPAPDPVTPASITLGQVISQGKDTSDDKRRNSLLASAIVPSPGTQIAYWTLNDVDGDNLAATFSLRRDGDDHWTDVAMKVDTPYTQFDTSHLEDGIYFTRLVVDEESPRPLPERLSTTFETDDLVIDRTPPEMLSASATRAGDNLIVSVRGRDGLSLLEGIELRFNNGFVQTVEQPADGIRDSREETFVLEIPMSRIAPATNVEAVLYDSVGNSTARRLAW